MFSISPTSGTITAGTAFSLTRICAGCPPINGPGNVAITPDGKTLFYGSSTGGPVTQGIGALSINPTDGSLSFVTGAPFAADDMPIFVLVHPSGKFLYTVNWAFVGLTPTLSSISCFSIDVTGTLAPAAGSPFPAPPGLQSVSTAFNPSGKYFYLSTTNGIFGWSVNTATGAISPLANSPFAAGTVAADIAFDQSGTFLYTSGGLSGGILGFSFNSANGDLMPLAGSPFFSGSTLTNPIVDPANAWLLAVDGTQKAIVAFTLDKRTGSLSSASSPPALPVPTGATQLVIHSAP
jgi:6-phosphogluconolactonase (cycloisomerase 2 family)